MTNAEWDQLMRAGRAGDRTALASLLGCVKDPLFAFLYRLTRNPVIAEDLLQETLATVCTRAATWDPARPLRPWVYAIARNKFLEWRRRERKIVPFPRPEELGTVPAADRQADIRLSVQEALARLSEPVREAFLLKHFARLSFPEVAEVQGIPLPTAKSRVLFAVRKLRELLGAEHE